MRFQVERFGVVFAACFLILSLSALLSAQLYTGTVTGVVTDTSGAVVHGAQVQLVDEQKGFIFRATSDASGSYLFRSVPPGSYRLSVVVPGFKTETRSGIVLEVDHNVTVNFTLQVGAESQSVEVKGEGALLDSQDAVTGQVIDRKYINDLPLVGRSLSDLAFLTAGVTEVDSSCPTDMQTPGANINSCPANNFISDGSRMGTSDLLIDGVSTSSIFHNILWPAYEPSIDSVEEFAVQETNFSAEYGFTGSTVTNIVTRSGTNKFRGTAYEYWRNKVLDANSYFNNAAGIPLPGLKLNNFGATVGGPIKRDKTFFFFDYDGTREATSSTQTSGVPSTAERGGDFGELCGYAGGTFDTTGMCTAAGGQLWDPYTGVYSDAMGGPVRSGFIPYNNMATYQSPGNPNLNGTNYQLPGGAGNLIDPIAAKYILYLPLPNYNVGNSAYNPYTNWVGAPVINTNVNSFDIKIDQRFTQRDLLSVKYSQSKNVQPPEPCYGNDNPADPCDLGTSLATAHLVAVNYTHTFTPSLLLITTYGLTRGFDWNETPGEEPKFKGISPSKTLGMPVYMDISGFNELPQVDFADYSVPGNQFGGSGGQLGTEIDCCEREGNDTHTLANSLNWVKGAHNLKFGWTGMMLRYNDELPYTPAGDFNYDPTSTTEFPFSGGGDDIASFLTGVGGPGASGSYDVPFGSATQSFQYALFIQDNWKLSKTLTLNLGIRDEMIIPQTERHNRLNELDPTAVSPLQVPALGTLHGGELYMTPGHRSNFLANYKDFGPRIGFSYQLRNNLVVRGGYGIYYSVGNTVTAHGSDPGFQGFDQQTSWQTTFNNDGATPWGRFSDPWPIVGPNLPAGNSLGLLNNVGFGVKAPLPPVDSKSPYSQTWTLGIQREFPSQMLLDITYVGSKGTHLLWGSDLNYDHLGPQIEAYDSSQIAGLETYVPNPFYGIITNANSSLSSSTVRAYQLQLPYPQFTAFQGDAAPVANSNYDALQAKLEKRFSHGVQFLATYTWSKSMDNSSSIGSAGELGGFSSLQDPNNLRAERSLSSFDLPAVLQLTYTYELPFGQGKALGHNANSVTNAFIGGWRTAGIWRLDDGRPEPLTLQGGHSLPTYGSQRPNLTGTLNCAKGSWTGRLNSYFSNPGVLTTPAPYAIGTAPRTDGSCRQPGQTDANLSVYKEFALPRLPDEAHLELRLESYNTFNHPQFAGPNTTVNSGSFGVITSQVNSPRQVQAVLRLYW